MKVIQENIEELRELCKKHHVREMFVFGSVLTEDFKSDSDIDLLVRFSGVDLKDYFDNFMDFKESLETLFSRPVDLVEIQTLKNPILKRSIDRSKKILYGREDSKMAV
jgi:predicted nucleotidyltransferase